MENIKNAFDAYVAVMADASNKIDNLKANCTDYINGLMSGKIIINRQLKEAFPPETAYQFNSIQSVDCGTSFDDSMYFRINVTHINIERHGAYYTCEPRSDTDYIKIKLDVNTDELFYIDMSNNYHLIEVMTPASLSEKYMLYNQDKNGNRINIGDTVNAKTVKHDLMVIGRRSENLYILKAGGNWYNAYANEITVISPENKGEHSKTNLYETNP